MYYVMRKGRKASLAKDGLKPTQSYHTLLPSALLSNPVADWPSGAPGVFPVGRCTMWAGPFRNTYIKWIVVNVHISFHRPRQMAQAARPTSFKNSN